MRWVLVLPALLVVLTETSSQANDIDQDTREFCLQAKDYLGCIKANLKTKNKEQKSKPFKINNKNITRPKCIQKPDGSGWKAMKGMPCKLCHHAYFANSQGKSTILSGNKDDKKQLVASILPKVKRLYSASLAISDRKFEREIERRLERASKDAKNMCPSLY